MKSTTSYPATHYRPVISEKYPYFRPETQQKSARNRKNLLFPTQWPERARPKKSPSGAQKPGFFQLVEHLHLNRCHTVTCQMAWSRVPFPKEWHSRRPCRSFPCQGPRPIPSADSSKASPAAEWSMVEDTRTPWLRNRPPTMLQVASSRFYRPFVRHQVTFAGRAQDHHGS